MDAQRLHYLRALDIDVWVPRDAEEEQKPEAQESRHEARDHESGRVTRDAGHDVGRAQSDRVTRHVSRVTTIGEAPIGEITASTDASVATLDWPALEAAVKACAKCGLHRTRKNPVFGVGNRQAQWMVIGEAPGADEDAQGEPFVGRAGQLLNSMIKAVGLQREDVYIANILKSRPPNNRDPAPDEVTACIPYLHRQIELVNPKLLLCVGRIAAQNLLNTDTPIGKLRGQVHRLGNRPVVVTYHPAYLLRSPGEKRRAWQDLVLAMHTMQGVAG